MLVDCDIALARYSPSPARSIPVPSANSHGRPPSFIQPPSASSLFVPPCLPPAFTHSIPHVGIQEAPGRSDTDITISSDSGAFKSSFSILRFPDRRYPVLGHPDPAADSTMSRDTRDYVTRIT